jgi:plastocyanin domain-containing protein
MRRPSLQLSLLTLALLGAAAADPAAAATKPTTTVEIAVTRDGFVPAEVKVPPGRPVKLVVTRKVERTCATEIVMKDLGVDRPLPLNAPVTIALKPLKPGTYRYACGMDMIAGALKVE